MCKKANKHYAAVQLGETHSENLGDMHNHGSQKSQKLTACTSDTQSGTSLACATTSSTATKLLSFNKTNLSRHYITLQLKALCISPCIYSRPPVRYRTLSRDKPIDLTHNHNIVVLTIIIIITNLNANNDTYHTGINKIFV